MSQRGVLIVAAALTAFVLVIAGGIAGRLSQPRPQSSGPSARVVVAARAAEPQQRLTSAAWRDDDDDDDDDERHEHEHRRAQGWSHDDED